MKHISLVVILSLGVIWIGTPLVSGHKDTQLDSEQASSTIIPNGIQQFKQPPVQTQADQPPQPESVVSEQNSVETSSLAPVNSRAFENVPPSTMDNNLKPDEPAKFPSSENFIAPAIKPENLLPIVEPETKLSPSSDSSKPSSIISPDSNHDKTLPSGPRQPSRVPRSDDKQQKNNPTESTTPSGLPISGQIVSESNSSAIDVHHNPKEILVDGIKTIIDLSYPLDANTLHWPSSSPFRITKTKESTSGTNDYKAEDWCMATHVGTHLDAPIHFDSKAWSVDEIPLERLVDIKLCVIDLSEKVSSNRTYSFTKEDFVDSVNGKPLVEPKSLVLVYTGLSKKYSEGAKSYMGTDGIDTKELEVPGFSEEAANYLASEVGVFGVGLDSVSADSSQLIKSNGTEQYIAHKIFSRNSVYILENVSYNITKLLGQSASIRAIITPLKITGGSGSPVRLIAMTSHNDCPYSSDLQTNSAQSGVGIRQFIFSALLPLTLGLLYLNLLMN